MRETVSKFFLTLDASSFWFGAASCATFCLGMTMVYSIACLWMDNRRVLRAEEEANKYGRHSIATKENASAVTEAIPVATPAPRSHRRQGRTDTIELPLAGTKEADHAHRR